MGKLTAAAVRNSKPGDKLGDGGGLRLDVDAKGNRAWIFRYTSPTTGRERFMGLGTADDVTLAMARDAALAARLLIRDGADPIEARKTERQAARVEARRTTTFREYAAAYIASHEAAWSNPKHRRDWRNSLALYAYPKIGHLPVADVDTAAVMTVLRPIWTSLPETASRVRQRIESILSAARVEGLRSGENPALWKGHISELLPSARKVRAVAHHAALPYAELPAFWKSLAADNSETARLLKFIIVTVARFSEAANADWSEIRPDRWRIPAGRMKARRVHVVPLSKAAINVLGAPGEGLVFASAQTGRPLSDAAVSKCVQRHANVSATTHGFRSTFRTWAAECTAFPREIAESALAHAIGDAVEQAYQRSDFFERRRELMDAWAAFTTGNG